MPLTAGARLGPYEIVAPLGAGGMGEVYRARDPKLQRDVAIKALPSQFSADPERMARFEREAHALAALNHPGIAGIHELLEHEGARFLVLEFVEGETLAARIARGPLPLDEALPIAKQIAEALEAAHEKGIVHRDLKPANIIVSADGRVKVLDFGLAKALDSAAATSPAQSQSPTVMSMTAGVILGTAPYMSPEQARGKPVDRRADNWAFGCVLYEMLTGAQTFGGETVSDTISAVLRAEPDFTLLPADTPPAVRQLLRRCLTKDLQQRLPHIGVARLELAESRDVLPQAGAVPASALRRPLVPWIAVAVLAAATTTLGFLLLRQAETQSFGVLRFEIRPPAGAIRFGHLTGGRGTNPPAPHFAISADGREIAFAAVSNEGVHLWLHSLATAEARKLPGTDDASFPFWSPDGKEIAFFAQGALKRIRVDASAPLFVCAAESGEGGSWGPDGTILLAPSQSSGIWRVSVAAGTLSPVTSLEEGAISHRWPQFLPDGRQFFYIARTAERSALRLRELDSGRDDEIAQIDTRVTFAAGHLLFQQQGQLLARRFDPGGRVFRGEPTLLVENVAFNVGANRAAFHANDSGVLIVRTSETPTSDRLVWRTRAGAVESEVNRSDQFAQLDLAPDDRRAVLQVGDLTQSDLWMYDLTRGIATRFTSERTREFSPLWSRDGRVVFYSASSAGGDPRAFANAALWVKSAGGADPPRPLGDAAVGTPMSVTPDGQALLVMRGGIGSNMRLDIWRVPVDGSKPTPVLASPFSETEARISPDGRWLAYVSDDNGTPDVYLQPYPPSGDKWRISPSGGTQVMWSATGRELFFVSPQNELFSVAVSSAGPAPNPVLLFNSAVGNVGRARQYAPSKDGKRFLMIAPAGAIGESPPLTVVVNWPELVRRAASR